MSNEMKQIGERLKGLRDALDISVEDFASSCDIPLEDYELYESGEKDMTISVMRQIGMTYKIDTSVLMFDGEPRMNSYFLTRKGKGMNIRRVEAYEYQTLAGGFTNRKADIFEVTVQPNDVDEIHHSSHAGQEFNFVLEGKMLLQINGKDLILETGDSLYFNSSLPHGMKALDNKPVKFIAVVL